MGEFNGKRITVMGLGLFGGGLGVTKFLCEQGAIVLVTDLSTPEKLAPSLEALEGFDVQYRLGKHDERDFTDADIVIVNPGVPLESRFLRAAKNAGVKMDTELNIFLRLCKSPVTAVTGTNGKSTTAALIHTIMSGREERAMLGGNIGRSLLDMLDATAPDVPVVLELSSFQLENARWLVKSPHVSVITNISPNHLDRHKTMEGYIEAKRAILDYQTEDDFAVLNADDEVVLAMAKEARSKPLLFSRKREVENGAFIRKNGIMLRLDGIEEFVSPLHRMTLQGKHNIENALAAVLAARLACWSRKAAAEGLVAFKGLEHRLEFVRELNGVRYYNDSIATNPKSVIVALEALSSPKVLIAGGYDKGIPFDDMLRSICIENVHSLVLVGQTKEKIASQLAQQHYPHGPSTYLCKTFEQAVMKAHSVARWGDTVLMSPGCASYGMFMNFSERGLRFKKLVGELSQ